MPLDPKAFNKRREQMKPIDRLEKELRKHFGAETPGVVDAIVLYVESVVHENATSIPASQARIQQHMMEAQEQASKEHQAAMSAHGQGGVAEAPPPPDSNLTPPTEPQPPDTPKND